MKTLLIIILLCYFSRYAQAACVINPFAMDPHPLIVRSGSSDWIYPIGDGLLRFETGATLDFICPNRNIIIDTTSTGVAILTGRCVSGNIFLIDGTSVNWELLSCSGSPTRSIRTTGRTCNNAKGQELEAGYAAGDGRFLVSLLICFNRDLQIAYYTYINQTAAINERPTGTPRPSWVQGSGVYTIGTVTNLYLRVNQKASVNGLLGLPAESTKYIKDSGNFYLARGHLTARSDGFYAVQQNATFYMQNIAPQWQTFNGFNWFQVEIDMRDYAESSGSDLQVWTGVYGVTTLPHAVTGVPTELYLFQNETSKALPVPAIFWKVAYNPVTQAGIALIGVNNPYITEFNPICPDVSASIPWFTCQSDLTRGYCYACAIPQFRAVVTDLPEFPVTNLLT